MPTFDEFCRMPVSVRFSVWWNSESWIDPPHGNEREYGTTAWSVGLDLPWSMSAAAIAALIVDPGSYDAVSAREPKAPLSVVASTSFGSTVG